MQQYIILLSEGPIYNEGTNAEWQKPSGHISGKNCLTLLQKIMQVDPLVQLEFGETDRWHFRGWIKNKSFKREEPHVWPNVPSSYFTYDDSLPCLKLELSAEDEDLEETMSSVLDSLIEQEIIFAVKET